MVNQAELVGGILKVLHHLGVKMVEPQTVNAVISAANEIIVTIPPESVGEQPDPVDEQEDDQDYTGEED